MVNCLVFAILSFFSYIKKLLQNFCLIKKWMMLDIIDKNVFKVMTLSDNLVDICKFKDHNIVCCSLYMIHEI